MLIFFKFSLKIFQFYLIWNKVSPPQMCRVLILKPFWLLFVKLLEIVVTPLKRKGSLLLEGVEPQAVLYTTYTEFKFELFWACGH